MNCTFVYTTHINRTHTHTDIALYTNRFMYRYTVLLNLCRLTVLLCTKLYTIVQVDTTYMYTHTCFCTLVLSSN